MRRDDAIQFDRRNHAVLLDPNRAGSLGYIDPSSIEPFNKRFADYRRLKAIFAEDGRSPMKADWLNEYLEVFLELSVNRHGLRAGQLTEILKGPADSENVVAKEMDVNRNGLRHRAQ